MNCIFYLIQNIYLELTVINRKCDPACRGKAHYTVSGSCPEECGEGGYCCSGTNNKSNKCSKILTAPYTLLSRRHYCLSKGE